MINFNEFLKNKKLTLETSGQELEPWKLSQEEFLKHVIAFKTSQGSLYAHMVPYGQNAGKTVRIKSKHQFHDPNDTGLKKSSFKTVYVKPEDSKTIGFWNSLQSSGKRIVDDGRLQLISMNPKTGQYGRDEKIISYELRPEVGLSPIELWSPAEKPNWFKSNHPGNEITEIIPREQAYNLFKSLF